MNPQSQKVNRRRFLLQSSLVTASFCAVRNAATVLASEPRDFTDRTSKEVWTSVRHQFALEPGLVQLSSFYLASHPRPVRDAIACYRELLDANPYQMVHKSCFAETSDNLGQRVKRAAADYLGGRPEEIALTQSTTMGLSLVYWGLSLQPGDELLITTHDHFVHHEAMRLAAQRSGATVRKIALYDRFDDLPAITEEKMVERIAASVGPRTRAVGLTWVHSSSGLRLPVRAVATAIRQRAPNALIVLDGVHGLGAVDETVAEMDVDIFVSGTHKWIFGPRGTGLIWAPERVWAQLHPVVPTFDSMIPEDAWMADKEPAGPPRADWFTPGGFHAFEHEWAVAEAFEFHRTLGRPQIATRIAILNGMLKDGLAGMRHVKLWTPRSPSLSAGLVGFDVLGIDAETVRDRLWQEKIVATASPYARRVVRFAAGIMNNEEDVEQALRAVTRLARH